MIVFFWWEIEGKEKGKKGFGSWERMRNLRALPLRYGKNLNRRRLRPSQFRKLYQSSSREGVEEEEEGGGGGGRWENGLTTLLPCDSENLLSSLLFVFPFSLIFFFFCHWFQDQVLSFCPSDWFVIVPKIPLQNSLSRNQWLSKWVCISYLNCDCGNYCWLKRLAVKIGFLGSFLRKFK